MTLIRIREQEGAAAGPNATLVFDDEEGYPLTIADPFSEQQEKLLAWYFEERFCSPFSGQEKAQRAADSIGAYGETLFEQVFADPRAHARYQQALQAGVETLTFEIVGSPDFHQLHWEALKDPHLRQPLALQAPLVRKNLLPQAAPFTSRAWPTINVLIVTARPGQARNVGYRTISRPLAWALRQADPPVQIKILRPGTYGALVSHLEDVRARHGAGYYHVIHLDVHGALLTLGQLLHGRATDHPLFQARYERDDIAPYEGRRAFVFLEGAQQGLADPVGVEELANLLITHRTPIAILNACQSGTKVGATEAGLGSRLAQAGVPTVLAMGYTMTVSAAELVFNTLYERLFAGRPLSAAVRRVRMELYNRKERRVGFDQTLNLEDWLLPVVYQNREQPLEMRDFTSEEGAAYYGGRTRRYREPQTRYGFVGRDLDVLEMEKRLLGRAPETGRNLLLLRGIGGAGKTALLHHVSSWWWVTGLVEQVFYFGYDEWAWTRQQIMARIAKTLLGEQGYLTSFQPLGPEAQQAMLTRLLRARRYLLILDNLESVTGAHLAIRHTLPKVEQVALRQFLAGLAGGRTLVLLGSRDAGEWLVAQGENADDESPLQSGDVYELEGLDPEAASILADRILEQHRVARYRARPDFQRLLDLLDGHPLALEVVLANLAHQTPAEMLEDLGDDETENILRCVDFAHSNLSTTARGLLLCLAPFKSVVWEDMLDKYTAQLWKQPALGDLPFERWSEVLAEAVNWGLLDPHPDLSGFWRLQPVLSYLLKQRLSAPRHAQVRQAIETAFYGYYDRMGRMMAQLLRSRDEQKAQLGQTLVRLEHANLRTALDLALVARFSIKNLYQALSLYLDAVRERQQGLELGQTVFARLEGYPADVLSGPLGVESVIVLDDVAGCQFELEQYQAAEASCGKAMELVARLEIDQEERGKLRALVYHRWGKVAQAQRQWAQAKAYYREALEIHVEFDDDHKQAGLCHQLGLLAQEQGQWAQARDHLVQAWETFMTLRDSHSSDVLLRDLARLWQASDDAALPAAVAPGLGLSPEEAEERLRDVLKT
jgi:tetratricopeptide (TPR) repeat protein